MKDDRDDRAIPLPGKTSMNEFIVPAQDRQGHSAVIHFRVPPNVVRDVEKLLTDRARFGWETHSDFYRWCVKFGFEYATKKSDNKQIQNLGAERKAIEELLIEEQVHVAFKKDLDRAEQTVAMLLDGGHREPLVRVLMAMKNRIDNMDNDYWRSCWQKEFEHRFGRHLKKVSLVDFNDEE